MDVVFTIGHSNHDWLTFERLLRCAEIRAIADLRTNPSSRLSHFNRAALTASLDASGITYLYLGHLLGGQTRDGEIQDFEQIAPSPPFAKGIGIIEQVGAKMRLALLCSEHDPVNCHRFLLVGRELAKRGINICHILRDGTIEPNEVTEETAAAGALCST
jgi:uncharacterized protein (DUF488 family)